MFAKEIRNIQKRFETDPHLIHIKYILINDDKIGVKWIKINYSGKNNLNISLNTLNKKLLSKVIKQPNNQKSLFVTQHWRVNLHNYFLSSI